MTEREKMQCIADSVEMEIDEITPQTVLADLENWDSVAVISIIAVINEKLNRFPSADEILGYQTVQDLLDAME